MKKALLLALSVLLLLSLLLTSCGGDKGETTPAPSAPPVAVSGLEDYTIVYPYGTSGEVYAAIRRLKTAIEDTTGARLSLKEDFVGYGNPAPTDTKEILIGRTNRAESAAQRVGRDDTAICFENNRVVITGGDDAAVIGAIDKFIATYLHDATLWVPATPDVVRNTYPHADATLNGVSVYDYVIVADKDNTAVAAHLARKITDATGAVLPVYGPRDYTGTTYEIVVGSPSGEGRAPATAGGAGLWQIETAGNRLLLHGVEEDSAYSAALALIRLFEGQDLTLSFTAKLSGEVENLDFFTLNLPKKLASMQGKYDLTYDAETIMDRFFATKEELPEEVTVVERVKPADYPLATREIYVSTNGDDTAAGTKEAPLATLKKALSLMEGGEGGVIWMMGGTYSLSEPVAINPVHSGSRSAPLFIKAYNNEEVVLTSTKQMDTAADKWHPLDPSDNADLFERFPEEARDYIIYTTLEEQGWTEADIPEITKSAGPPILYVSGEEYTLARYPNNTKDPTELMYFNFAYDSGTVTSRDGSNLYWPWVERATKAGKDPKTWIVGWEIRILNTYDNAKDKNPHPEMGEEILSWVNTGDIWYYGSTFEGWEFGYYNLALETEGQYWAHTEDGEEWYPSYDSDPLLGYPKGLAPDGKTPYYSLKSIQNNSWGCKVSGNSAAGRNTFYLFNAVEALDVPGEWFFDRDSGVLYLYPTEAHEELSREQVAFSNSTAANLMNVSQASYVVLDGLTFDGSSSNGLSLTSVNNVVVQNCVFRNTKASNLIVTTSTNTAVIYCDFSRAYGALVTFSDSASAKTLTPCGNVVQNCFFHDPMPLKQTALTWAGCRMVVSHNYFNSTTTSGSYGVECILEYNRFEGGSKDVTDGGMIYSGGAYNRGNHYRYNLFHMLNATHRAVYNDTMGGGNYMYYNVVSTLHSRSSHSEPWYSSTGWGNVAFGNITVLRTPFQVAAAGSSSSEAGDFLYSAKDGDTFNESALFYYYFGDEYSAGGAAARYQPRDYDGMAQKDFSLGTNSKVSFTSQPTLSQSLAGHWWLGIKQGDTNNYLRSFSMSAWSDRAPEFINMMYGTQLIVDLYADPNEDYHVKYFYMPWYLTGKTYTYDPAEYRTATPGKVVEYLIPEYSYLVEEDGGTYLHTVPAHVVTSDEDGCVTLTYEEIAAMERSRRAPQYCVVSNNIILGSTPIFKYEGGKYVATMESDLPKVVSDTAGRSEYRGYVPTSEVSNNFIYYDYEAILPYAEYDFEYYISDESWDFIAARGLDDPAASLTAEVMEDMMKIDYMDAGLTYPFNYGEWYDDVYPD